MSISNKMSLKNLADLNENEFKTFLDSFDHVLCDCDGVLWYANELIIGVKESIDELKKYGKKIKYVTNNCLLDQEQFTAKLNNFNFNVNCEDFVNQASCMIDYLKSKKFNKSIFLIGPNGMKSDLINAGYNVVHPEPVELPSSTKTILDLLTADNSIGAVIVDFDFNLNYMKMSKAVSLLRNPDVLFLGGATEFVLVPKSRDMVLIGPGYFQQILESISKRKMEFFGKPSNNLNEFAVRQFQIKDPARTLFIGDALDQDIRFANKFGYQNLLVLTGRTSLDMAKNERDIKIDYYVNSLGDLHKLMNNNNDEQ